MSQDITELMMAAIAAVIAETQADGDDPAQVARQLRCSLVPRPSSANDGKDIVDGRTSRTLALREPMTDTRKVIVNGTEYEVELEGEGTQWKATVGKVVKPSTSKCPEAAVAAKPRRSGGRKKKLVRFPPTILVKGGHG